MKLVNTEYSIELDFDENQIEILIIEAPSAMTAMIGDIWNQVHGEQGNWILSENGKVMNISKEVVCIFNPFDIDCNEKKVLNSIYKELENISKEELYEKTQSINSALVKYIEQLTGFEAYSLTYSLEPDISALLKAYDVKIDTCAGTIAEKLLEYMTIQKRICKNTVFVTVNLKQYISQDEIEELYKNLLYEKIHLLEIEAYQQKSCNYERTTLIDKDLCIVQY